MKRANTESSDRDDKNDPSIQFIPKFEYTPAQVEAGNKLAEVLNNPGLSDADKKQIAYDILNS
jgi:hypothetical protein